MTLEQDLAQLGLKENEVKVYLAALEMGESTVGKIERHTNLHKQLIYNAADSLQDRGLLCINEVNGRKRFSVMDPTALEEQAKARVAKARQITPRLFELANQQRSTDKVRVFRDLKSIQQYYLESTRNQPASSEVFILGVSSRRFFEIFDQQSFAYQRLEQLRTSRHINWNIILFAGKEEEATLNKRRSLVQIKLISEAVQAPIDMMIWHNHVGLLFYGAEPYVLDISGQETAKGFKEYFQVLWNKSEVIKLGQ